MIDHLSTRQLPSSVHNTCLMRTLYESLWRQVSSNASLAFSGESARVLAPISKPQLQTANAL